MSSKLRGLVIGLGLARTLSMSIRRNLAVVTMGAIAIAVVTASTGEATAQPPAPSFPFDAVLTKPLGFRTKPTLDAPHVLPKPDNYLDPTARIRVLGATGPLWSAGTFCNVEYKGARGYLRCDADSGVKATTTAPAPTPTVAPTVAPTTSSKPSAPPPVMATRQFCNSESECKTFCSSTCTLDVKGWNKGTMNSTCKFSDDVIKRSGGPAKSDLRPLPAMTHVKGAGDVEATQYVLDALKRLNDHIAANPPGWPSGHVAFVKSCYRPPLEEATRECDFILKGMHLQKKWANREPQNEKEKAERAQNLALAANLLDPPGKLGLTWPGPSPHSNGVACDIVMAKTGSGRSGDEVTTCGGTAGNTTMKAYSKALDEALTNPTVGAVRLNYEMWHYEFGRYETTGKSCRCVAPACNDKHWPPTCDGPSGC
jgi:hypothetical protein